MWLQRKAINNSTFRNESDIGKAVSDWTCNYNTNHRNITRDSLHDELMYLFTSLLNQIKQINLNLNIFDLAKNYNLHRY